MGRSHVTVSRLKDEVQSKVGPFKDFNGESPNGFGRRWLSLSPLHTGRGYTGSCMFRAQGGAEHRPRGPCSWVPFSYLT